jgi:hypothetical protein
MYDIEQAQEIAVKRRGRGWTSDGDAGGEVCVCVCVYIYIYIHIYIYIYRYSCEIKSVGLREGRERGESG